MNEIAISVQNVSKSFRMYNSPAERMKELLHPFKKKYHKEFWALRDISLEIPRSSTLGIIGQNGSGKSTLLQIICGILQPSSGSVEVNGRISALLELGAGFNRDFTGRENVFMNGAVMGISRNEMEERFDRITEFAAIGHFIDQPVKTYSSGMYVRLAFALAINIDPDILIVDEALSVGDIKFQRKCFAKIEQFRKEGKTILFVTHSLSSVNLLCDTAVLIDKGKMLERGDPKEITRIYQNMMLGEDVRKTEIQKDVKTRLESEKREKDELVRVKSLADERLKAGQDGKKAEIIDYGILDKDGNKITLIESGKPYTLYSKVLVYEPLKEIHLGYPIQTVKGLLLFAVNSEYQDIDIGPVARGDILDGRVEITMWLAPGNYFISFRTGVIDEIYDQVVDMHFIVTGNLKINPLALVNLESRMTVNNIREHGA